MNITFPHFIELLLITGIIIAIGIPLFGKVVRKEEVLLSIKELEVDLQADKVSVEDSDALRSKIEGEAIAILERIDELKENKKKHGKSASKNFLLA